MSSNAGAPARRPEEASDASREGAITQSSTTSIPGSKSSGTPTGTDLLLTAGAPPLIRVDGEIRPVEGDEPLTRRARAEQIVMAIVGDDLVAQFESEREVDFAFSWQQPGPAALQRLPPARHLRHGAAGDPLRDPRVRRARHPPGRRDAWSTCPWVW